MWRQKQQIDQMKSTDSVCLIWYDELIIIHSCMTINEKYLLTNLKTD